jgi:hypothetical protein
MDKDQCARVYARECRGWGKLRSEEWGNNAERRASKIA